MLDDGPREQLRMGRSAFQIDVAAVRLIADHGDRDPEAAEQLRRDSRRRTVGAVDGERESAERQSMQHRAEMLEVGADEILVRHVRRFTGFHRPRRIGDDRLDLALDPLGEFLAAAREHFDAVVLERIVRRGDHDASVVRTGARQIRDRGRRHDAGARDHGAFARCAVRELGFDPRTRLARVAPDEDLHPARCLSRRGLGGGGAHQGGAETANGRSIERISSCGAADAVGAEQPRDRLRVVCHW